MASFDSAARDGFRSASASGVGPSTPPLGSPIAVGLLRPDEKFVITDLESIGSRRSEFVDVVDAEGFPVGMVSVDEYGAPRKLGFLSPREAGVKMALSMPGIGLLVMPSVLAVAGSILGTLLIWIAFLVSLFGHTTIAELAVNYLRDERVEVTLRGLASRGFPGSGGLYVDSLHAMFHMGLAVSWLIVLGDCIQALLQPAHVALTAQNRRLIISVPFFLIMVPLALQRYQPRWLRCKGPVSVAASVLFIAIIVVYVAGGADPCARESQGNACDDGKSGCDWLHTPTFATIGVISITFHGFSVTTGVTESVNSAFRPTLASVKSSVRLATVVTFGIYTTVALGMYSIYGSKIYPNALHSFPRDPLPSLARAAYCVTSVLCFPGQLQHARDAALRLTDACVGLAESERGDSIRWWCLTCLCVTVSWLIAMFEYDLGAVIAVTGALTAVPLVVILPAILHDRLSFGPQQRRQHLNIVTILFGILVLGVALIGALMWPPRDRRGGFGL